MTDPAAPIGVSIDELEVDVRAQKEGDWVPIPDQAPLEIKTRSSQSHEYQDAVQRRMTKAVQGYRKQSALPSATVDWINREALLETCTLDWRGLIDRTGRPVPYDPELLRQPKNQRLLNFALYAARIVGERQKAVLDDDAKNSDAPSGGPAVTAEPDPAARTTG